MKITVEFASIRDMLFQLPKFGQLISGDAPGEERMEAALADDPTPLIVKITPKDGLPFTEEEKEAIQAVIRQYVDRARIEKVEKLLEEHAPETSETAPPAAPEEKAEKNPPKDEKPGDAAKAEVTQTAARAALNGLVKSRGNAAVKLVFHELGAKNFGDLTGPDQYAEAVARAEAVGQMTDEDYEAALKDAGIKGGKK